MNRRPTHTRDRDREDASRGIKPTTRRSRRGDLALLKDAGIHGVFRMSGSRTMPFPAREGERERRGYNRHRRQEPLLVRRIEVNLRHLKRTLGMNRLKCRSLDGMRREMLMYAPVYNAVCAVRMKAAAAQGVALGRVRFIDALRWMLIDTDGVPVTLRQPPDLKLWPIRPPRNHPRLLKHGGQSSFRVMPKPRRELIKEHANRPNHAN